MLTYIYVGHVHLPPMQHSCIEVGVFSWVFDKNFFCLTTNIDNLTQRAGFPTEKIHMCHGNMFQLQCTLPCSRDSWKWEIEATGDIPQSVEDFPHCPHCGRVARPNIYRFGDSEETYVWEAQQKSAESYAEWLNLHADNMLMVEIGCGTGAPGLRDRAERYLVTHSNNKLIRINLSDISCSNDMISRDLSDQSFFIHDDPIESFDCDKIRNTWKYIGVQTKIIDFFT